MAFIETTIHIDRRSAEPQKAQAAEESIGHPESVTSVYVKMEFMRSFVKAWCYLNNIANEASTFHTIFLRIQKLQNRKYLSSHCIGAFGNFFQGQTSERLLEKARVYFGDMAKLALRTFGKETALIDLTNCYLAQAEIRERKGHQLELRMKICSRNDIRCNIVNFFKENQQTFERMYSALAQRKNLDGQLTRMRDTLGMALHDPSYIANRSNCWRCGDAIIVAEAPPESTIVTTDGHYEILAPAAGKRFKIMQKEKLDEEFPPLTANKKPPQP